MKKIMVIALAAALAALPLAAQSAASPPSPLITDGLSAFYPFDGNGDDASGNGNDINAKSVSFDVDRYNQEEKCLRLAGEKVDTGVSDKGTVAMWLKVESHSTMNLLSLGTPSGMDQPSGFEVALIAKNALDWVNTSVPEVENAEGLFIAFNNKPTKQNPCLVIPAEALLDRDWHFLALAWNGDNRVNVWVDGRAVTGYQFGFGNTATGQAYLQSELLKSPFVMPMSIKPGAGTVMIGNTRLVENHFNKMKPFTAYNGYIDDLRIYSRPLKDAEIKTLYNENKAK
jgi:hypothetical protein